MSVSLLIALVIFRHRYEDRTIEKVWFGMAGMFSLEQEEWVIRRSFRHYSVDMYMRRYLSCFVSSNVLP